PDADLTAERLAAEVDAIVSTPGRLDAMARAVRGLARPAAAERLAQLAERHARRPGARAGSDGGGARGRSCRRPRSWRPPSTSACPAASPSTAPAARARG